MDRKAEEENIHQIFLMREGTDYEREDDLRARGVVSARIFLFTHYA